MLKDVSEMTDVDWNSQQTAKTSHLRERLSFLALDLKTYQNNPSAEKRLSASVWRHCIGPPYLVDELEAKTALECTLGALRGYERNDKAGAMTLGVYLDQEAEKLMTARRLKAATGMNTDDPYDFVLCTSHDLAPILQQALGLDKGFHDSKAFKRAYKAWEKVIRKQ